MDPNALIQLALSLEQAVMEVVPLRGHWEIWYQIELARLLRRNGVGVRLEDDYRDGTGQRMDILMVVGGRQVTVELKVESSTNPNTFAGLPLTGAAGGDLFKSRDFQPQTGAIDLEDRWVLVVAYSQPAIIQLARFWNDTPPSYLGVSPGLGSPGGLPYDQSRAKQRAYFQQRRGIAAAVYVSGYY